MTQIINQCTWITGVSRNIQHLQSESTLGMYRISNLPDSGCFRILLTGFRIRIPDSIYIYIYIRLWPATNIKDARMSVCLVVWVYIDGRRLFMRSDFYYWLTTVVIVTVLFGLFIEFLWTTAKVPDIVCRIPDSGYYRISQILPDNPALPDIRYIPSPHTRLHDYNR